MISLRSPGPLPLVISLWLALWLGAASALAETRSALVIGNDTYGSVPPLRNARNDARAMAGQLEKLGFTVTLKQDTNARELETAVRSWTAGLSQTDVALFFYAGHGVQVEGINYLVPVDFEGDEIDIKHSCLSAEMVRERMERSGPDTNIIVLDACRNNPFSTTRGSSRGLVFMEGNVGTLIAFATSPGGVSDDNPTDSNGLFTKHLLANLATPGLEALQVFQNVGRGVYNESQGSQRPWISASVMPRAFFFVPQATPPLSPPGLGGPPSAAEGPVEGPLEPSPAPLTTRPEASSTRVPSPNRPPEATVASAAPSNLGREPKKNIVLLLVADNPEQTRWLLEHTRQRIYEWYGGSADGTGEITLNVEFISYSDSTGRETVQRHFGVQRQDLPVMVSAFKIDGQWAGSIARQRKVNNDTDLEAFFETLFEPPAP